MSLARTWENQVLAKVLNYVPLSSDVPEWMSMAVIYVGVGMLAVAILMHGLKMRLLLELIGEYFASAEQLKGMFYVATFFSAIIFAYVQAYGPSVWPATLPFVLMVISVIIQPNSPRLNP